MSTWSAELAKEQGRNPASAEQWWTSADFVNFLRVYEASAIMDAKLGNTATSPTASSGTPTKSTTARSATVTNTTGKVANRLSRKPAATTTTTAAGQTATTPSNTVGTTTATVHTSPTSETTAAVNSATEVPTDAEGRVPLYEDNPYVFYPSEEDVPSDFEQESFEEAVAEMNAQDGSDVDDYLQYLQDAESTPSYTEVEDDEDPEDPRR
jgi:hypothetical protein